MSADLDGSDIYAPAFVKSVFDRCSGRYIWFSFVCSFGFTERWRRQCVQALPQPSTSNPQGYDLMAGTGEAWPYLLKRWPGLSSIVAVDISSGMHRLAMKRLHRERAHRIEFREADVLAMDLPDESADFIISTFGLKTFNADQHVRFAATVMRVLKPGGVFSMIEASDPKGWWLRPLYRRYLQVILPLIERFFLRGAQDFAMIGRYTANFSDASAFATQLREQGLEVSYQPYFFGCATGVHGRKPSANTTMGG
ncbi:MAG: class I SAM-dependent methyltransferase [Pseudomonadota bacterium]|nr:class I SAM-dependent methyltransferase [Pseudomonadota bacterium]